jgi:hypothetical protein
MLLTVRLAGVTAAVGRLLVMMVLHLSFDGQSTKTSTPVEGFEKTLTDEAAEIRN